MILRRNFLLGLISSFAAPAIVRAESLMPIKLFIPPDPLVLGIRWQSWPFGLPEPATGEGFAVGSINVDGLSDHKLKPLSLYLQHIERYKNIYPELCWRAEYETSIR